MTCFAWAWDTLVANEFPSPRSSSINRLLISGVDPAREFSCVVVDEVGRPRQLLQPHSNQSLTFDCVLTNTCTDACLRIAFDHAPTCQCVSPALPSRQPSRSPFLFLAGCCPQVHHVDDASRGALYELLLSKLRYLQARAEHKARQAASPPAAESAAGGQAATQGAAPERPQQYALEDAGTPAAAQAHQQQGEAAAYATTTGSQAAGCSADASASMGNAGSPALQAVIRPCDWIQLVAMSATVPGARAMARWLSAELFSSNHRPKELRRYLVGWPGWGVAGQSAIMRFEVHALPFWLCLRPAAELQQPERCTHAPARCLPPALQLMPSGQVLDEHLRCVRSIARGPQARESERSILIAACSRSLPGAC